MTKSPHFKGRFASLQQVWMRYPSGGTVGDYIFIGTGTIPIFWSVPDNEWVGHIPPPPPRVNHKVDGSLTVVDNLLVGGRIVAKEIILTEDAPLHMIVDTDGDNFLTYGESLSISCRVINYFMDLTEYVRTWTITRDSGDAAEDAAWALLDKAKNFDGSIIIDFSDLGRGANTVFRMTAELEQNSISQEVEIM